MRLANVGRRVENVEDTAVSMDIVFRATEAGYAWYVWSPASGDIHHFASAEDARRFARLAAVTNACVQAHWFDSQCSLEQAATLV